MQKAKFVTLNYSLPKDLSSRLDDYCERTGRTASEVVRQLVLEFVEGDRSIRSLDYEPDVESAARSSVRLRASTFKAFDQKVTDENLRSKGAVLACLLTAFLERLPRGPERVLVTVSLPVSVVQTLTAEASNRGQTLAGYAAECLEHHKCEQKESV